MRTNFLGPTTRPIAWTAFLRTRPGRRLLVAGLAAACAVLVALGGTGVHTPLAFVLLGLIVVQDLALLAATHRVAELAEHALDERQEAVRNHAYRLAYRVVMHALIWPIGLVVVLASFSDPFGWLAALWANTALVVALGTGVVQLLAFLPTMILAWTEPDPIEAE
jgi:hypothetical protein